MSSTSFAITLESADKEVHGKLREDRPRAVLEQGPPPLNPLHIAPEQAGTQVHDPVLKYFLVLDINGLLLVQTKQGTRWNTKLRPGLEKFLEFCLDNFEVVFWSCVQEKRFQILWKALQQRCPRLDAKVRYKFDQSFCETCVHKASREFYLKRLQTLFDLDDGLKGTGASSINTLLVDDSPYKNVANTPWNAVHPTPYTFESKESENKRNYLVGELIPWLTSLKESKLPVPEYCQKHSEFGQRRLFPGDEAYSLFSPHIDCPKRKRT